MWSQHTSHVGCHRSKKGRALPSADLQPAVFHKGKVAFNALDVGQIDQITLVAADKMIFGKLLFGTLQAGTCRELAFGGVVVQHPAAGLQIIDIRGIQQLDAAARQLQHHLPASAPLHPLDGAGQFGAELIIVHRLQHIIQCIYLVAPDGILCHVGHKDQHHLRIHCPDGFGSAKAVQPGHLHIHKNDVEPRRIVLCDFGAVCNEADTEELTLRSGGEEINEQLEQKLNERLAMAGMEVVEARINYLAYAPEIAAVMLRRQQASAIITAREKIVEGAVSMVKMALHKLSEEEIVELDEDKKAAMVSNLLVVLCADEAAQPVVNTGTLNH